MTLQDAIKKSVEGGYTFKGYMNKPDAYYEYQKMGELYAHDMLLTIYWHQFDSTKHAVKMSREFWNEQFLLDPLFWQALGKSLGWNKKIVTRRGIVVGNWAPKTGEQYPVIEYGMDYIDGATYHWHRLIDHLAEGNSIETYFAKL